MKHLPRLARDFMMLAFAVTITGALLYMIAIMVTKIWDF